MGGRSLPRRSPFLVTGIVAASIAQATVLAAAPPAASAPPRAGRADGADCPIPAERLFASFARLRNPTDAGVFGLTCLEPLIASSGGLAPLLARFAGAPFDPLQAGLLVSWADAQKLPAAPVLALLRDSLARPREIEGYWLDARGELRAGPNATSAVVTARPAPAPDAGVAPRPRAMAFELVAQTATHAKVHLAADRTHEEATGWIDKRQLLLPGVVDASGGALPTYLRLAGEVVVLRAEPSRFVLGFAEGSPAAALTVTVARATGAITAVARAGKTPPAVVDPSRALGRTCVAIADRVGYVFLAAGVTRAGHFYGFGLPAECR